ncbi:MAG: NERD domain-containing protein [Clostridia bacterium]|nr:NERD domain-containing protein [Clostridia bacterium]
MENLKTLYSNLTSVNIDEQKKLWDERGKGYYGEYLVFCELYKKANGISKFIMNANIPVTEDKTTEVDLMMLHETGLYVFEIKHYKGTIYGKSDDATWTQYFRTVQNSTFKNPVKQNEYHISALKKLYPDMPIYSVIVFTNEECEIKITNTVQDLVVSKLSTLFPSLNTFFSNKQKIFSLEQIDSIFTELSRYSPMREETASLSESEPVPFYTYIETISAEFKAAKAETEKQTEKLKKQRKIAKISLFASIVCAVIACAIIAVASSSAYKQICDAEVSSAMSELREMEKNFEKVDLNDANNRVLADGMLTITTELKMSEDLKDTAVLNFTIKNNAKEYGIILNSKSALLVTLLDGTVKEYKLFNSTIKLSGTDDDVWYPSKKDFTNIEILDVDSVNDIEYIKITNVAIWNYKTNQQTDAVHEFEVYSK